MGMKGCRETLTAALTAFGTASCMGHGPLALL